MKITRMIRVSALLLATLWAMPAWAGEVYRLTVDGLACPFCAYGVEKKLGAVEGVEKLDIDINAGVIRVTMAEETALDEATAKQAVEDASFTLRHFEPARPEALQ